MPRSLVSMGKGSDSAPLSVYVHIPFCVKKCNYCDFLSFAETDRIEAYVEALCAEIASFKERRLRVSTCFLGGGTPTRLTAEQLHRILCQLKDAFIFEENAEITIEANPGTIDLCKLKQLREDGVNRISIGLQSTKEEELRLLGRIHDFPTFLEGYEACVKAGFTNRSVDLMMAIPGQTYDSFRESLETVLLLDPPPTHLSVYSLIVEPGTKFYEEYADGKGLPDEDTERKMYALTCEFLEKRGYRQYEISNFAKEGFASRHNSAYWVGTPYLGLGLGAAGFLNRMRYSNVSDLDTYVNLSKRAAEKNDLAAFPGPSFATDPESVVLLTEKDEMEERMFLGLRMNRGVCEEEFEEEFGQSIAQMYPGIPEELIRDGLLERKTEEQKHFLRLTAKGRDLSNYCMAKFLFDD